MNWLLQWRQPTPPIVLRWRGPDNIVAPAAMVPGPPSIPTLIGPPGAQGPAGPAGPIADIIDGGTFN